MRKKFFILAGLILLLATILTIVNFVTGKKEDSLVKSAFIPQIPYLQSKPSSIPSAEPAAPQTFHFDSSTDLKKELDSINPQVLDSDFE
ncbi:MAG: hypothetical protein HYW45_03015 [Candidatus Daviesbacteria bacterium]|nr:MAG: hypothetical protein HYW45_03015 [Candidatus Daviesbacteria bacterium]